MNQRLKIRLLVASAVIVLLVALVGALNLRGEPKISDSRPAPASPELIERGAYLARAGNCIGCHTQRGGAPLAGGVPIATPFGTIYATNLTPDTATGIGSWNADHFYRALHNGRSKDGRLLYPAFPYEYFTRITREDSDALFAWLGSQLPVQQANRAHELRFPYGLQASLAVWRAAFFTPAGLSDAGGKTSASSAIANTTSPLARGEYLVRGLGHCGACHTPRNAFAASKDKLEFGGGQIPMQDWYAPALTMEDEGSVAKMPEAEVVALLKTGVTQSRALTGPMAEITHDSLQYLDDADLHAMAAYLRRLPQVQPRERGKPDLPKEEADRRVKVGAVLYENHCQSCHGADGRGQPQAYPALAGNRAVNMDSPANAIRVVLEGGYAPTTAGNPRPYGMPPFAALLSNEEVAAVLSYVRASWGNQAGPVDAREIRR